jgi:hypothetical protein
MVMRVLIACEESQTVCKAFRELGHEAFSCDILPCSGGKPEWHIQDNVLNHLNDGWNLMIAHPPCTFLSLVGAAWIKRRPERIPKMYEAIDFFKKLQNAPIKMKCIENPMIFKKARELLGEPTQIIEPYFFGDAFKKRTCLWLSNLPKLEKTNEVLPEYYLVSSGIRKNHKLSFKLEQRGSKNRSKTFPGIAKAMAEQWGKELPTILYSNNNIHKGVEE